MEHEQCSAEGSDGRIVHQEDGRHAKSPVTSRTDQMLLIQEAAHPAERFAEDLGQISRSRQTTRSTEADLVRRIETEDAMRRRLAEEELAEAELRRRRAAHGRAESQLRRSLSREEDKEAGLKVASDLEHSREELLERRRRRISTDISKERDNEARLSQAIRREKAEEARLENERALIIENADRIREIMSDLAKVSEKIRLLHDIEDEELIRSREILNRDIRTLSSVAGKYRDSLKL